MHHDHPRSPRHRGALPVGPAPHRRLARPLVALSLAVLLTGAASGCSDQADPPPPTEEPSMTTPASRDDLAPTDLVLQEQIPFAIDDIVMIMTMRGSDRAFVQVDGAGIDQELELPVGEVVEVEGWRFELADTSSDLTAVRVTDPEGVQLGP